MRNASDAVEDGSRNRFPNIFPSPLLLIRVIGIPSALPVGHKTYEWWKITRHHDLNETKKGKRKKRKVTVSRDMRFLSLSLSSLCFVTFLSFNHFWQSERYVLEQSSDYSIEFKYEADRTVANAKNYDYYSLCCFFLLSSWASLEKRCRGLSRQTRVEKKSGTNLLAEECKRKEKEINRK